jgi:hypothetical protein
MLEHRIPPALATPRQRWRLDSAGERNVSGGFFLRKNMNREQTKTERTDAFKNGQRIGYFDHDLKTLVIDGDAFTGRETWKDWLAFKKAHTREGISQFLFQCIAELKADGNKKGSIKVPYERLRARLKLRKIGLSNNRTPFAARAMAYMAKFDTRYRDKGFDLVNFFTFDPLD